MGKANRGSFKPGQSGNPGGRRKQPPEVREALREHTAAAIDTLVKCLSATEASVRVRAAAEILDRAYGKPTITVQPDMGDKLRGLMQRFVDGAKSDEPDGGNE